MLIAGRTICRGPEGMSSTNRHKSFIMLLQTMEQGAAWQRKPASLKGDTSQTLAQLWRIIRNLLIKVALEKKGWIPRIFTCVYTYFCTRVFILTSQTALLVVRFDCAKRTWPQSSQASWFLCWCEGWTTPAIPLGSSKAQRSLHHVSLISSLLGRSYTGVSPPQGTMLALKQSFGHSSRVQICKRAWRKWSEHYHQWNTAKAT